MQVFRILALPISLLALPTAAAHVASSYLMRRPTPDPVDTPAQYGLDFQEVQFFSRNDQTPLVGWWIPAPATPRGTIIFCHGHSGSMDRDTVRVKPLHTAGFNVLMFDFRAHGRSGGQRVTYGMYEKEDLLAAIDYLNTTYGVSSVGLYGISMGAATAIITATLDSRVKVLVVDSASGRLTRTIAGWWHTKTGLPIPVAREMARWTLASASIRTNGRLDQTDPLRWVRHLEKRPILYIFGGDDPLIDPTERDQMIAATPGVHEVKIVEGVGHRGAYDADPVRYMAWVTEWFEQHPTW